jgi:hypothetical protein
MATFTVDDPDLVLALSGWERPGGLHRDIRASLRCVEDVAVSDRPFEARAAR